MIIRESISINESFIDYFKKDNDLYEIHVNPSISQIQSSQRLIGDQNGNLWCAVGIGPHKTLMFITHTQLHKLLVTKFNKKIDPPYKTDEYKQGNSIALQRYPGTNVLVLGESYVDYEINRISKKTWDLLKKKHREFKFIYKEFDKIEDEDLNEAIKHLTPKSDEEIWKHYLELIENSGMSAAHMANFADCKSFFKVAEKLNAPIEELYMINEEDDDLDELFKTLVDGEKFEWLRVDDSEYETGGNWKCFLSMKLARWVNDDMNAVNAWIFSKKFFKNFKVNEAFDSPGAKAKFSKAMTPEEIKKMTYPEPYKNLFQYGAYHGKDSGDLNVAISDTMLYSKDKDALAVIEGLYRVLIKKIPQLKNYEIQRSIEKRTERLHLNKHTFIIDEITKENHRIEVNLWIYFHQKSDNIFGYKKGKFRFLFCPTMEVKHMDVYKPAESEIRKSKHSLSIDIDDAPDTQDLKRSLQHFPDAEDRNICKELQISYDNVSAASILNEIPKIEKNIKEFYIYLQEKYNIDLSKKEG